MLIGDLFCKPSREHVDGGTSRSIAMDESSKRSVQAVVGSRELSFFLRPYSTSNNSTNCNLAVTVIDLDVQNARVGTYPDPPAFCLPNTLILQDSSANVQEFGYTGATATPTQDPIFLTVMYMHLPAPTRSKSLAMIPSVILGIRRPYVQVNPAYVPHLPISSLRLL